MTPSAAATAARSTRRRSSSYMFTRLALLCTIYQFCCLLSQVEAGGKGKGGRQGHIIIQNEVRSQPQQGTHPLMPIYMPIPIPIPVPSGPPPQGKFHPQQQQQHHIGDDEGEVKKIYLLQPVQKLQPQPQLKGGGYMGPIQTHIHMPAAQVLANHRQQQQQQQHRTYSRPAKQHQTSYGEQQTEEKAAAPSKQHYSSQQQHQQQSPQSELKILPIVVIPPIAPMPPIQLPPTSSNTHQAQAPRMTLTPQFNNYVVAASDRGTYSSAKKPSHRITSGGGGYNSLQDHKSFSDYNFAGSDAHRSRPRMRGSRHVHSQGRPPPRMVDGELGGHRGPSRLRHSSSTIDEESIDDFDHSPRHHQSRGAPRYASSRRRSSHDSTGSDNSRPRFHQQVIEQSALFDDEPTSVAADSSHQSDNVSRNARRFRQFVDSSDLRLINANSEESRIEVLPASREQDDYDDQQSGNYGGRQSANRNDNYADSDRQSNQQSYQSQQDQESDSSSDDNHRGRGRGDSASVYYDSGYQQRDDARETRRMYQPAGGEREIFEDDEWRFDTIKSVIHADPPANNSTSMGSNATSSSDPQKRASTATTTTLVQPPTNASRDH